MIYRTCDFCKDKIAEHKEYYTVEVFKITSWDLAGNSSGEGVLKKEMCKRCFKKGRNFIGNLRAK